MALLRFLHHRFFVILVAVLIFRKMCYSQRNALMREDLSDTLVSLINNLTKFKDIQQAFDSADGKVVSFNQVDLLDTFSKNLRGRFDEKVDALKGVQKRAETEYDRFAKNKRYAKIIDDSDDSDDPSYPNMRTAYKNTTLSINARFSTNVPVNMNESFVHVPTNIYDKSRKVLEIENWTRPLNDEFKKNFKASKEKILYQYYGDHTGFLRVYPGNNNNFPDNYSEDAQNSFIDLYDCRRRPWYVQATSSPKDIVIIIDFSGSMIGSNIGIAKIATASLIDTLEENDFFNVIAVNDNVTYMKPCLTYLLQATKRNKERMKQLVQDIGEPTNELNHTKGLEVAFHLLNNSEGEHNRSYAGCNRAIMFITDGIEGDYAEEEKKNKLFEKYNKDKTTRIFTYLVGRKNNPDKQALIDMACNNKGYFYKIETLGNVWDTVLEYLYVMSLPLVAHRSKLKPKYTPVYLDSSGIGMIMSISMGVFVGNGTASPSFRGVVGTDLTIKSLSELIPHPHLSTFNHFFVVSNNGFVVMHPKLREQTGNFQTGQNPPSFPLPPNILLEDIEYALNPEHTIDIKRNMIDRNVTDTTTFPIYFIYDDDDRKITIINGSYNVKPIPDTEFSAGVVTMSLNNPTGVGKIDQFDYDYKNNDTLLRKGIQMLLPPEVNMSIPNITITNHTIVTVAPWDYLDIPAAEQDFQPASVKQYPTANEIYNKLADITTWSSLLNSMKNKTIIRDNCTGLANCTEELPGTAENKTVDPRLVGNLLISAGLLADIIPDDSWVPDEMREDDETYKEIFVATSAGYQKIFTWTNMSITPNSSTPKFNVNRDIINSALFEHAEANPDASVIFSAPYNDKEQPNKDPIITGLAPIRRGGITLAVTGVRFKAALLDEYLRNVSYQTNCYTNDEAYLCALLDQNGYILASNKNGTNGRFIGEQSEAMIDRLVEEGYLKEIKLSDTQGDCKWEKHSSGSANILLTPAKIIIKSIAFLFKTFVSVSTHTIFLLVSLLSSQSMAEGEGPEIRVSCTKRWQYYLFQRDQVRKFESSKKKRFDCIEGSPSGCRMDFSSLNEVSGTNLFYLQVDFTQRDKCQTECRKSKNLKRIQLDDVHYCPRNENDTKVVDTTQKYRRRPTTCFRSHIDNDVGKEKRKCGAANLTKPITWVLLVSFVVTVAMVMR